MEGNILTHENNSLLCENTFFLSSIKFLKKIVDGKLERIQQKLVV